jgi:HK97 family phage prohead protease
MKQSNIQTRSAQVENVDLENRKATFAISSESVDSYRTVFTLDGWELEQYHRNPIVCYNHQAHSSDPDTIIGTSRVYREGNRLMGEVTFEEDNSLADKVMRKVKNGTLRMASVGASIHDYRMGDKSRGEDPEVVYFTRHSLNEWSIVSVGANPDAFKRNDESLQAIRSEAVKDIETTSEAVEPAAEEKKRASTFDVFEAQLIVNQNAK